VADNDAEAEELYAEHMLYFYNRCLHIYPGFSDPAGYRTVKTIKAGVLNQLRRENQGLFATLTWKDLVEGGFVIAGSPDTVRERMEELIKTLRVGTVFGLFHMGNMPDWKTRYSTQLFAEKVMPQLRNIWPEYEHDTRWWVHPLEDRVQPEVSFESRLDDWRARKSTPTVRP
jgi:alkanesulfonate monooxygenase SsuD/methylene tetrahydromethanopterin reductase-like flavin-dependent oxidoreductase (luciferase family)